jgi:hypothetical protein
VKQSVFKRVSAAYLRAQKIEVSDHLGGVRPSIYGLENCGCVSEVSERLYGFEIYGFEIWGPLKDRYILGLIKLVLFSVMK